MSQDKDLAISRTLAEHEASLQDTLDKLNELWLFVHGQKTSFEKFKAYMEAQSKESTAEKMLEAALDTRFTYSDRIALVVEVAEKDGIKQCND